MMLEGLQFFQEIGSHLPRMIDEAFRFNNLDVLQGSGAGNRVVAIGVEVLEDLNGLPKTVCASDGSQGHITRRDPLGHRYEVRLNVKVFDAKPFPGPSKTADHLIDDEGYSIPVADPPDDFPVLFWRGIGPESLLDGFSDEGRDLFRVLKFDGSLNIPCAGDVTLRIGEMEGTALAVRRINEEGPRRQGFHHLPHGQHRPQGP